MASRSTASSSGLDWAATASACSNAARTNPTSASTCTPHGCSIPISNCKAGPYRLHNIQPSRPLDPDEALRITAGWS